MTNYTAAQKAFYSVNDYIARLEMIEDAHEEALCLNEWFGYTEEQIAIHHQRVIYGLELRAALNAESVLEACHSEALDANLMHDWATSDIDTARACQAAADKGLFLYAVYRHEWKECGGYVDAHADIKMLPRDGKVQLHLRTSAASWWQHDSTHIDAASAYNVACAIFETTDFVKLEAGHG